MQRDNPAGSETAESGRQGREDGEEGEEEKEERYEGSDGNFLINLQARAVRGQHLRPHFINHSPD